MKVCCRCKVEKDTSEFCVDRARKDGLNCRCKQCSNANGIAWLKANRERNTKYQQQWRADNREKVADRLSARVAKYPEQRQAQVAAYREYGPALQYECVRCGQQAQHWHHWSYNQEHWTSVIPVCVKCHSAHHAGILNPPLSLAEAII